MKIISIVAALFVLTSGPPAWCQHAAGKGNSMEIEDSSSVPTAREGYRVIDQNGFQIVEHGAWTLPGHADDAVRVQAKPRQFSNITTRPRETSDNANGANFRRSAYLPWVYAAETRHALPPGLLDALIWTESRYNPFAISTAGAAGLGQLMPKTARELGIANRFNPGDNINGAARYLRQMLNRFGLVHLALAAYNAGPGAVVRSGGIPVNRETPSYVSQVLSRWSTAGFQFQFPGG